MNRTSFFVAGLLLCITSMLWLPGCASVKPGNDPLVVRCEQAEYTAKSTFDLVLNIDQLDRTFWRSNAPAFHAFCEWLRAPQPVWATNSFPRASAMILDLNTVKQAYKSSAVFSNDLLRALSTLDAALVQANAWSSVITNR